MVTRDELMKELKKIRELIYARNNETSDREYQDNKKIQADMEYLAMMADVDMEQEEEVEE